jgi:hypothetical protein
MASKAKSRRGPKGDLHFFYTQTAQEEEDVYQHQINICNSKYKFATVHRRYCGSISEGRFEYSGREVIDALRISENKSSIF